MYLCFKWKCGLFIVFENKNSDYCFGHLKLRIQKPTNQCTHSLLRQAILSAVSHTGTHLPKIQPLMRLQDLAQ